MLIRLSKNTFVRNYGNFTYIFHKLNAYDEMFEDRPNLKNLIQVLNCKQV